MGPPPFGDGNLNLPGGLVNQLQWGHRLSAMETQPLLNIPGMVSVLQWGHRLSAMETVRVTRPKRVLFHASMGPPPFGDGNMTDPKTGVTVECKLQWGHRLSAMETETARPPFSGGRVRASMGPPPFGDGNPPPPRRRGCRYRCFNGATAFRRWKQEIKRGPNPAILALQWGHRLSAMETRRMPPERCSLEARFNGATAFRRWKRATSPLGTG